MVRFFSILFFAFVSITASPAVMALEFPRPPLDVDLVGAVTHTRVQEGETLLDVARRFDIGQDEILIANPTLDRWLPKVGASVVLPTRYVLPRTARVGITLNVSEMRLYYFPPAKPAAEAVVDTYPVGIGRMDWNTPLGETHIIAKIRDPSWYPPESIRRDAAARGDPLPEVVPPGPDNPLGRLALRLGIPGYLIHSTNRPYGVGMRVSHGCVRMYPEDIESMFSRISVNTPVFIVDQPVKVGWLADTLYIEVHPPLEEDNIDEQALLRQALDLVEAALAQRPGQIRGQALRRAVHEQNGVPLAIGHAYPGP